MTYLITGCLAFAFLVVFDFNKIKLRISFLNTLFALGSGLLLISSIMLLIDTPRDFDVPILGVVFFSLLSMVSGLFMFYALFGALPFKKTYVEVTHNKVIDSGLYALCRHPGVWGFFFMYFFAFLASGRWVVLTACILWTGFDILHVWLQDVYFFPKMLEGYDQYQQTTPFLIFNPQSLQRCANTFGK
jgi:protein-S-isoprenylcysteine O-methyltransferase Ste14